MSMMNASTEMTATIPLAAAMLCCNCFRVFALVPRLPAPTGCAACGSEHFVPVERRHV